ncbi:hypothetical protein E2R56_04270 [Rhodococcus qingshengii]|nr:hypothetical protein E2R56_04270 [Rhodococcus qingshengii]
MNGGKTVEGIEGMLYITNDRIGDEFEDYMSMAMYEYSDEVVFTALELRGLWVSDSNNPTSLAMEKYIAELLNLNYKHYSTSSGPMEILTEIEKKAIEAIYRVTQKLLSAKEVSHVVVYRGFCWSERPEWVKEGQKEGQTIRIDEQRTLSSWSFSQEIAKGFVHNSNFGFVVKALMPVERIYAIIDIIMESESVCISHDETEEFEVVFLNGGDQYE